MQNNYFGKFEHSFILYIDPIHFDVINFSKHFSSVCCNEIVFTNSEDNLQNTPFDIHTFIEKLKNQTLSEFDLIFDNEVHIQNIWWDDILIISNLDKMDLILNEIRNTISNDNFKYLEISLRSLNNYFTCDNNRISKENINPNDFLNFIKNSDRYQDKELKFF